jgi:hypothetical protein
VVILFIQSAPTKHQLQLASEVSLSPSILGAGDGNSSLGRFRRLGYKADTLEFDSDYFLATEFVDRYKDEVKWRKDNEYVRK